MGNPGATLCAVSAPGETDLAAMLTTIDIVRRPGEFVYVVRAPGEPAPPDALAKVDEGASVSYVVPVASPAAMGGRYRAAWLTLTVQSSLDAVGLMAAVSGALAAAGVPCNVLAGFYHDHLLVPTELADSATSIVAALRNTPA